jgi:DnaJ family protein C protein 17
MADQKDVDWYEVLGVVPGATKDEINKAYKKKALKLHPDKNRDNPNAAALFQQVHKALEILSDDKQRAAIDAALKAKFERQKRDSAMDQKRRDMKKALYEREEAHKKQTDDKDKEKKRMMAEYDRLRTESRKRQKEAPESSSSSSSSSSSTSSSSKSSSFGGYGFSSSSDIPSPETTVKVKWSRKKGSYAEDDIRLIMRHFGEINFVKMGKNTALVGFTTKEAMEASVSQLVGNPENRLTVKRLKPQQSQPSSSSSAFPGAEPQSAPFQSPFASAFPFMPFGGADDNINHDDFEQQVLAKMMQAAAAQKPTPSPS